MKQNDNPVCCECEKDATYIVNDTCCVCNSHARAAERDGFWVREATRDEMIKLLKDTKV